MNDFLFNTWFRLDESRRSMLIRYCSSLSIVVVVILTRIWLEPVLDHTGFALSLIGMLATAWLGGLGPSLIAQTLILFSEAIWFNSQHDLPSPLTVSGFLTFAAFHSMGIIVGVLSDSRRAARKRALVERNEAVSQREQLCATLACVGDGVLVADAEGRLTLLNPVAETMTGWSLDEAKGKPVRDVFAICNEQSLEPIENPVQRVLREGLVLHELTRLLLTTRNKHRLPVAYSAAPIRDADGKTTGVVLIVRDETQRRRTETALRDADQRKDEFLATLAHELRNPLAPICMGLELMKISANNAAKTEDVRSMMERQSQQMVRLIDDLLDVSRITRGKLELRRRQVRLTEVVRNAVEAARPVIDEAEHELHVSLPEKPVLLDADPNRLTQVLSNLLNNAAKYTPKRGRIELSAEEGDGEVAIVVADNGCGIPGDMLERVFEMFTQVHGPAESGQTGLGIGLTLVKQLVELHGGTVDVESAGKDSGTRFTVRLPVLQLPTATKEKMPSRNMELPQNCVRRRILIVDDNDDALNSMSMLVSLLGNDINKARDGVEAVEMAEQWRPEVIVMDIGMPRMNGYEAARLIRAEPWGSDIVLVAMTGWGQDEDRRRSKDAGFDFHLVKPVELATLREVLAGSRITRDDISVQSSAGEPDRGLKFSHSIAAVATDGPVIDPAGDAYRRNLPR